MPADAAALLTHRLTLVVYSVILQLFCAASSAPNFYFPAIWLAGRPFSALISFKTLQFPISHTFVCLSTLNLAVSRSPFFEANKRRNLLLNVK